VPTSVTSPRRGFSPALFPELALALAAFAGQLSLSACGHSVDDTRQGPSGGSNAAAGAATNASAGSAFGGASAGGASSGGTSSGGTSSGGVSSAGAGTPGAGNAGLSGGAGSAGASAGASNASGGVAGSGISNCPSLPSAPISADSIIQFNDNGAWNWFQDERAVVDQAGNKLVIGSVASGGMRDGNIEAVVYDIATGSKKLFSLGTALDVDDHNAPAFLVRPDGKYFAMWSSHRMDCYSRTSIFDGAAWSAEKLFDWSPIGCPWASATTNKVTYSNPWYVGGSIFAAVRSVDTDPAWLTSADDGATLSYYGRLTTAGQQSDVAGYFKYWGNNSDRIDFVGTEAHPRDFDNNLWHGYFKEHKLYDTKDKLIDDNVGDDNAQSLDHFSKAVESGSTLGGVKLGHLWDHDIVRYADGTIVFTGQGRVAGSSSDDPDLRMIYARYDGSAWRASYLAKAGHKLFPDEQDYTGLSALHPENPNIVFISTNVDPRDDTSLTRREIFEGVTCDAGTTWHWAPLTQNSAADNIRPIVPKWDSSHTLLLWLKGTYNSSQSYKLAVVGATTGL
jgi:hypothetical protein